MQDLFPITENASQRVASPLVTHLLYTVTRRDGVLATNSTMEKDVLVEKLLQREASSGPSLDSAAKLSGTEAYSTVDSVRANLNHLPGPVEPQDLITFFISVLTWFAEWIVSNPIWALRVWIYIFLRAFSCSKDERSQRTSTYRKLVFSKISKRWLLITPALIGLIPIAVGLVLAYRLETSEAGVFAMGHAVTTYDGYFDPDPKDDLLRKGVTIHMTYRYQSDTGFDNLLTEYLIALCIASTLLLFSSIPLVYVTYVKYIASRRDKRIACLLAQSEKIDEMSTFGDEELPS